MRYTLLLLAALSALCAAARPAAARATITVLYFDNDSGDAAYQHLGKGLADMMITDLSSAPDVQVVEREKLEALLKELKLQRTRYFDARTAQKIGKGLGAEYAVTGAIVSPGAGGELRLDARVIRIDSGAVVKAEKVQGRKDQFFDLYQRLVTGLIAGLPAALSGGGAGKIKEATAKNRVDDAAAAAGYGQALELRDRGDVRGASEQLQKAVERAPGFGLARARYRQFMKELYAAKDLRSEQLSGAAATLMASIDRHLTPQTEQSSRFAYRVLRGHLLLRRLADGLGRPAKEYLPRLHAYRDNQLQLVAELEALEARTEIEYNPEISVKSVEPADISLAKELQLPYPSSPTANKVLNSLAAMLFLGFAPGVAIQLPKQVCYYKADGSLLGAARQLLEKVQRRIDRRADQYRKRLEKNKQPTAWADEERAPQVIDVVQSLAQLDLAEGKREEAVMRLQGLLTRFPKARQFQETEAMIRSILDGSDKFSDGTPLLGCVDPR